jgi:MFS family permease
VTEEANSFKSLANSFDHYLCDDEFFLNLYASCTYFGGLLGYMFVTFLSDNYGRRKITIIAWAICTLGLLLLVLAQNMQMAAAALFLCGFGSDSVLCVTTSVMVECYEDNLRQKHCTIIQMAFTGGALLITLFFWLWQDWQPAVLYGLLIPSAITLFLIIWFVR